MLFQNCCKGTKNLIKREQNIYIYYVERENFI